MGDRKLVAGRLSVISPHADRVLAAHVCQGATHDCGPYVAAMLLNGLTDAQVDAARLARGMDWPRRAGPVPIVRRVPRAATFPWGVVDVLRAGGLRAGWRPFADRHSLFSALLEGRLPVPIVGAWRPLWAHYIVLLAHDSNRGWGFADPQSEAPSMVWRSDDEFMRQWRAFATTVVEADPGGA